MTLSLDHPSAAKLSLAGLTRARLGEALAQIGVPSTQLRMRTGQLWRWIYVSGVTSFDAMTDVSKELRSALAVAYTFDRPEIVSEQVSTDGTRKWLLRLPRRGHEANAPEIETVYIPESDRGTLCISSQVGCTLTCTLLPHGDPAPRAQSRRGGDRRPDPARARPHRRLAVVRRHANVGGTQGAPKLRMTADCSRQPSARSPTSC